MEDQLKARLIGASLLVLLAVLLIPELLSARKPATDAIGATKSSGGTRTYTIDLGGAVAAGARLEPTAPAAKPLPARRAPIAEPTTEDSDPSPADNAATPAVSRGATSGAKPAVPPAASTTVARVPSNQRPEPVPAPTVPVTKPASAKGQWTVQVGAFSSAKSADKLIGDLRRDGYSAYEAPVSRAGKTLHRVRVGPEVERAAADQLSARLKQRGLPATVVAND